MNLDNWIKELERRYGLRHDIAIQLVKMGAAIRYVELMNTIYGRR